MSKDVLIWFGGALLIVVAVIAVLWLTAPEEDTLPSEYAEQGTGVL